jgi:hypothetical protein
MGVRTVSLLRALRDRPGSTVDELAIRLHWTDQETSSLLGACRLANVASVAAGSWSLSRQGRQLLERIEARQEQRVRSIAWMMRENRGLVAA